ncbi:glycosyltransferase family 4 protein [Paraburkholderia sp. GAS348]|uniref:glycosyltransferase family 4 protein n=1 Tax=Paraburkholderia sp. GAS348 TaxID=3035132 RepID=UPI003D252427
MSTTKRVLLVGNYALDQQKSMQAYAQMLLRGLRELGVEVEFTAPKSILLSVGAKPVGVRKWIAYVDKFVIFPIRLRHMAKRFDWVHICDHSNGMYIPWIRGARHSVTCHDVIAIQAARGLIPGWRVGLTGRIFQTLILRGIKKVDRIICASDLTRRDLQRLCPETAGRSVVVHNGLHSSFARNGSWQRILAKAGLMTLVRDGYFLHVGSDLPRKNRIAVVRIFAELRRRGRFTHSHLVFVGPPPNEAMREIISYDGMEGHIHVLPNVDHEHLQALYSGATALIFPSLNEGFGWPVIEAQACGCPVFASNVAPMPEVGGDAACYFDPADAVKAAALVEHSDLVQLRSGGYQNSSRFTVDTMIRKLLSVWCYEI